MEFSGALGQKVYSSFPWAEKKQFPHFPKLWGIEKVILIFLIPQGRKFDEESGTSTYEWPYSD